MNRPLHPGTSLEKFCSPEHNIPEGCSTIRLGTLDYYRNMEPADSRADANEGTESLEVSQLLGGTENSRTAEEFRRGFGGDPGPSNAYVNCKAGAVFPNTWIWCCSMVYPPGERPENTGELWSPDYTSSFTIGEPRAFAMWLGVVTQINLRQQHLSEQSRTLLANLSFAESSRLTCGVLHHPVVYVDSKVTTISESVARSYAPDLPMAFRPAFTKTAKYSNEREYRFMVVVQHDTLGIISVAESPVDLPVTPLHRKHV